MTTYMLTKIKPGRRQKWLDWCEELNRQKEVALITLKEEATRAGDVPSF